MMKMHPSNYPPTIRTSMTENASHYVTYTVAGTSEQISFHTQMEDVVLTMVHLVLLVFDTVKKTSNPNVKY